jgi:hypothetical protein
MQFDLYWFLFFVLRSFFAPVEKTSDESEADESYPDKLNKAQRIELALKRRTWSTVYFWQGVDCAPARFLAWKCELQTLVEASLVVSLSWKTDSSVWKHFAIFSWSNGVLVKRVGFFWPVKRVFPSPIQRDCTVFHQRPFCSTYEQTI